MSIVVLLVGRVQGVDRVHGEVAPDGILDDGAMVTVEPDGRVF